MKGKLQNSKPMCQKTQRRQAQIIFNNLVAGKSTLLSVLGNREVPIPEHIDIFHLTREMPASDKTALQCVMEVDEERIRLEKLAEELVSCDDDGKQCVMSLGLCFVVPKASKYEQQIIRDSLSLVSFLGSTFLK
jgi:ATPase subunit of ABC transporter with duplicated ATPase domains